MIVLGFALRYGQMTAKLWFLELVACKSIICTLTGRLFFKVKTSLPVAFNASKWERKASANLACSS